VTALLLALALFAAAPSRAEDPAVEASGDSIEALHIAGQVQIRWTDAKGSHVLTVGSRDWFPDGLPADAELTVLDADATFRCGGALLTALTGTIFSAGASKGVEYIFVRQGELEVKLRGETKVLNRLNPRLSFRRRRPKEDPASYHLL
jgi:quercetin dioxygenase-like cupin family protein